MIIRSAFISVLLHLLILFAQNPRERGSWLPGRAPEARILNLDLRFDHDVSIDSGAEKPTRSDGASGAAARQYAVFGAGRHPESARRKARVVAATPQPATSDDLPASMERLPAPEHLRLYRLNLARSARLLKVYPSVARVNGWEGTVLVSVMQPARGGSPVVSLVNSSGHAVLDRQALEMLEQAARQMVVPEELRGQAVRVSLTVIYSQND